jgi:hypothetical protein
MKWIDAKKQLPELVDVNYNTRMSGHYLVWLKDDTATLAYVIQDKLDNTWEWRDGVDITRLVTHWCPKIEGPK